MQGVDIIMQATIGKKLIESLKPQEKLYEVWDNKLTGFVLRVYPTGNMMYICQYARGKRVNIGSTKLYTPVQAREKAKQIFADVLNGADPKAEKKSEKDHTLESFILQVYEPWAQTHHRNRGKATVYILKANFFSLFGKKKLNEITSWNIEKWRSKKLKEGAKPTTVNRNFNPLKAALNKAVDWGFIDENPLTKVKQLKIDKMPLVRYLTDDEEMRLRNALDLREEKMRAERLSANEWRADRGHNLMPELNGFADYLKPMILLSINTGLRRGEIFNLKWQDINFDKAMLTVIGQSAKSGQTRHVPLNDEVLSILKLWQEVDNSNELVFHNKGERFDNVNNSWKKVLKDANITNFRWHDMRHHFASRLVMAGVDLNTVRELLGHSDTKMTLRYAHLAPAVKAAAVQKLVRENCQIKNQRVILGSNDYIS